MKNLRRTITRVLTAIIVLLVVVLLFASNYMVSLALKRGGEPLTELPYERAIQEYPAIQSWLEEALLTKTLRDTFITDDNGLRLHALYAAAPRTTTKTAVIIHGYTDTAVRMLMIAYMYHHNLGYNILLPDLHAHGMSEGDDIWMGWKDRLDAMRWMDIANEVFGHGSTTQMVVHGISMGAATTMCVAGETSAPYVKAFIEDCGYTSVWDEFKSETKKRYGLPAFPLLYTSSWMCRLRYGWWFSEASPLKSISSCTYPMLFIHGSEDTYVPTAMSYALFKAKPQPKQIWLAPGSEHAMSYHDYPQEYTARVKKFLDKYIQ